MLRFLAQTVLTIIGNAIGLIVASWLLSDFVINGFGFATSIIFFTIAQLVLAPFVLKMAIKYLPAIRGGIALVTTFIILVLTTVFTDGLVITGVTTWVIAPLIVWACTVLAGIFLPMILFKKALSRKVDSNKN